MLTALQFRLGSGRTEQERNSQFGFANRLLAMPTYWTVTQGLSKARSCVFSHLLFPQLQICEENLRIQSSTLWQGLSDELHYC